MYRQNKTAIPGNEFGSKNSEPMRVAHSRWIGMDFGMKGLSPSCRLYEQEADL
jgi:hypothetical protein